jgi:phosphatidylserine decarboxylase
MKMFIYFFSVSLKHSKVNFSNFSTLEDFFIRPLDNLLSYKNINDHFNSPCEGVINSYGSIEDNKFLKIKNIIYNINSLTSERYHNNNGYHFKSFINIYLSPRNYHRIHSSTFTISHKINYIKGNLYPVAPWAFKIFKDIFSLNERTAMIGSSIPNSHLKVGIVFVGAFGVGDISVNYKTKYNIFPPLFYKNKDEIGSFKMGSSIILLLSENIKYTDLYNNKYIFTGDKIGDIIR